MGPSPQASLVTPGLWGGPQGHATTAEQQKENGGRGRCAVTLTCAALLGACASLVEPHDKETVIGFPKQIIVPDVGTMSVGQKLENSGLPREPETLAVVQLVDGRPLFRGRFSGYDGYLLQGALGTVVWTDECAFAVPKALLRPPSRPNQAGWGLQYPPLLGLTYQRRMLFFTALTGCHAQQATYTATSLRQETGALGPVTVVETEFKLNAFVKIQWLSHVRYGEGEVYASSERSRTVYPVFNFVGKVWQGGSTAEHDPKDEPPTHRALIPEALPCDVLAFGDSLTEGLGASRSEAYPQQLEALLWQGGWRGRVCNEGLSGSTTATALLRLPEVLARKALVVVVAFGANDALAGMSAGSIRDNLIKLIGELQRAGATVVLAGFNPPAEVEGVPAALRAAAAVFDEVATTSGAYYMPWLLEGVYPVKGYMSTDGLHPNGRGYAKVAASLAPLTLLALGRRALAAAETE